MGNNTLRYVDPLGLQESEEFDPTEMMEQELRDAEIVARLNRGGHETSEERAEDLMAGEAAARAEGRDPNKTYIQPRPEDVKSEPCPKGGVYALRDPASRDVMRTGRSKDLERRERELARDPRFKDFDFDPIYLADDYSEQRGLEQIAHDQYQPPFNYIQPISPGNPNYMNYGQRQSFLYTGDNYYLPVVQG